MQNVVPVQYLLDVGCVNPVTVILRQHLRKIFLQVGIRLLVREASPPFSFSNIRSITFDRGISSPV